MNITPAKDNIKSHPLTSDDTSRAIPPTSYRMANGSSAFRNIQPNRTRIVILEIPQLRIPHRLHLVRDRLSRRTLKRRNSITVPRCHNRRAKILRHSRLIIVTRLAAHRHTVQGCKVYPSISGECK